MTNHLYLIHGERFIYSTYMQRKVIMFVGSKRDTMDDLMTILVGHKTSTGKWLNNGRSYKYIPSHKSSFPSCTIQMGASSTEYSKNMKEKVTISHLDLFDADDAGLLRTVYKMPGVDIFMVNDVSLGSDFPDIDDSLLTINGFVVQKPSETADTASVLSYLTM